MKNIKITKQNARAFKANMTYLLDLIGTRLSPFKWEIDTLGGKLSDVYLHDCDHGVYSVTSRFKEIPPDGAVPCWLYDSHNGKCNWHIAETDDLFTGWLRPFEEIAKDLALLIHGEGDISKAIAAKGILEDFLPEKGHLQLQDKYMKEMKKMTINAFRKRYEASLGNRGWVTFSGTIHLENAPYSPFIEDQIILVYPA